MVKAIPEGYHSLTPHLVVNDAAAAIEFYKKAFGNLVTDVMSMPGPGGKIMHAELKIGNSHLMLADEFKNDDSGCGMSSPKTLGGTPISLHLYVEDVDAVFAQAVKAGAKEEMPVSDMFWGDRYGQVTDPFGHRWSIATHTRDLTPEQIAEGSKECFAAMAK